MAMEIFTVGRGQEGYPERLMPFADMPSRLFVRGALRAELAINQIYCGRARGPVDFTTAQYRRASPSARQSQCRRTQ